MIKPYFEKAGYHTSLEKLIEITPLIQERIVTLDDAVGFGGFFFEETVQPDPADLIGKNMSPEETIQVLKNVYDGLAELQDMQHATAEPAMRALIEEMGLSAGQVFGVMRIAITGQKVSPPLFESMQIIGREKVLSRLKTAVQILGAK